MNLRGKLLDSERWYLAKRYGVLWRFVALRVSFKRKKKKRNHSFSKPLHLIINELKQRGESDAIEGLKLILEDVVRPYDPLRITFLIAVFFSQDRK